ncbi:MAG: SMP-30/gluconolactonase/LRE family protein [Acidobacteria bacterium]|nr:SMP-30/gluconolactonase/LRE family protein [Acidobacteriota bacterium]
MKTAILAVLVIGGSLACSAEALWEAKPLTGEKEFTSGIEGPAVDRAGNIFAVSFARTPTIGKVTPEGKAEVFLEFTNGSLGNGIRIDKAGPMFVADYAKHNVLKIDPKTKAIAVLAHDGTMNQPNDIALMKSGRIYASDPDWGKSKGQVWVVEPSGTIRRVAADMGTTNGIEVSPDEKTLYVNESVQRNVWAFSIQKDGSLTGKRLVIQFPDFGMDGMRCDVAGNLYITRHGKGTVAVLSPAGKVLREVRVLGANPTNLCFGGVDGRTVYVTEVEHGRLVAFRVDRPGREWKMIR